MDALAQALPSDVDLPPTVDTLLVVGVVAASVLAILALTRRLVRIVAPVWRHVHAVHEVVEAELRPNGGTSVKDTVDRVETKVDALSERVAALESGYRESGR